MRQQALALMVIGLTSVAGTLSSTVASADNPHSSQYHRSAAAQGGLAQTIIATVEQYIGYPYSWSGSTPQTGFSCVGLVYYVYTQRNGVQAGRNLNEAFAIAPHVDRADLQPADLVFFSGTVPGMTPLSHVAIYVGNGMMIAADSVQTGVEWDNLNDKYWSEHYAGATRPLAGTIASTNATTQPPTDVVATATSAPTTASGDMTVTVEATPTPVAATAQKGASLTVATNALAVRSGPGDSYIAVGTVAEGTALVVLDSQDAWYHVAFGGNQVGWVAAYGVATNTSDTQSPRVPSTATENTAISVTTAISANTYAGQSGATTSEYVGQVNQKMAINADVLNVHSAPGRTTQTIGQLTFGTIVVILRVQRAWNMVKLSNGMTGWVFSQYLSPDLTLASKAGANRANAGTKATQAVRSSTKVAGFKQKSTYRVVVVHATVLLVRAAPSTKAKVVTQVRSGDRLRVVSARPQWIYVVIRGGQAGWVSAKWVG